jgi:hypothetical protein
MALWGCGLPDQCSVGSGQPSRAVSSQGSVLEGVDSSLGLWAPGSVFWRQWTAFQGCELLGWYSRGHGWPSSAVDFWISVLEGVDSLLGPWAPGSVFWRAWMSLWDYGLLD